MFELALTLLETGLEVWAAKEKNFPLKKRLEMIERKNYLKERYRAEKAKAVGKRNNAVMDNCECELRELVADFLAAFGGSLPGNQPS